jgi:hypothetical protein
MGKNLATKQARFWAVATAALTVFIAGCVERRVLVRTNPPGAMLYVDDQEIGMTPITFAPTYYGSHKIRLVKDGYETKQDLLSMPPPWYEIPPLDFFSENTVPGTINDMRTFDYPLTLQAVVRKEDLLCRAEGLRRGTQTVTGVAAPGFRVNPPAPYVPPAGTPGGPPIGGQPYYQLPPAETVPAGPSQPIYTPPPSTMPVPAPAPAAPFTPSNVGSQPFYPLPSGR